MPSDAVPVTGPPRALLAALGLLGLEALALVLLAGAVVADLVRGLAAPTVAGGALVVFLLGFAALLVGAARALAQRRRWGRGPAVTWQLIQSASLLALGSALPAWALVPALGAAAAVTLGVLWPSSRDYTSLTSAPDAIA